MFTAVYCYWVSRQVIWLGFLAITLPVTMGQMALACALPRNGAAKRPTQRSSARFSLLRRRQPLAHWASASTQMVPMVLRVGAFVLDHQRWCGSGATLLTYLIVGRLKAAEEADFYHHTDFNPFAL